MRLRGSGEQIFIIWSFSVRLFTDWETEANSHYHAMSNTGELELFLLQGLILLFHPTNFFMPICQSYLKWSEIYHDHIKTYSLTNNHYSQVLQFHSLAKLPPLSWSVLDKRVAFTRISKEWKGGLPLAAFLLIIIDQWWSICSVLKWSHNGQRIQIISHSNCSLGHSGEELEQVWWFQIDLNLVLTLLLAWCLQSWHLEMRHWMWFVNELLTFKFHLMFARYQNTFLGLQHLWMARFIASSDAFERLE